MALNIHIFDGEYRITSDDHNIVVHRKVLVDPTKSPKWKKGDSTELVEEYKNPRFYPNIEVALRKTAEMKVRHSDATTLNELAHEIRHLRHEIRRVLALDIE